MEKNPVQQNTNWPQNEVATEKKSNEFKGVEYQLYFCGLFIRWQNIIYKNI